MSDVDSQKLPVLYRAANDIFSSPKGYYRNSDGTYFSGNADITYLCPEDQINVANLIIQLTKSTIGEFDTKWKLATGTSPNAILEWGNGKRFEIQIAGNYTKYQAYGFDPSEIQQPILRNILNQKQRTTVSELDKIISQLRRANTISGLSSTALNELNTNTTPHITTSDRSQRPANTFEEMVSASRQHQAKGRIGG